MPSDSDDEPLTAAIESEKVIITKKIIFVNVIRIERRRNLHRENTQILEYCARLQSSNGNEIQFINSQKSKETKQDRARKWSVDF